MDAVPGRLNSFNALITRPGVFFGSCYELCGVYHGYMPINLISVADTLFDQIYTPESPVSRAIREYDEQLSALMGSHLSLVECSTCPQPVAREQEWLDLVGIDDKTLDLLKA